MIALVLDASVLLRWIIPGELPPAASRVENLLHGTWVARAPGLLVWEIVNTIVIAERRGTLGCAFEQAWQRAWDWLPGIELETWTQTAAEASAALARQFRLTGYDAGYLELALRYDLPLATLDQQLYRAAVAAGVTVDF